MFDGKFLNQDRIRVRICKILKLDPNSVNSESLMIQKLSTRIQKIIEFVAGLATGRKMDIFPLTYGEPFAGVGPLVVVGVGVGTAAPTTPTTTEQEA